ncbi:MAG: hypothetical protein A3K19_28515 [Lentisphaerae bacterium RIFOXYB12_FULL_65_16]|nr:MAG: hypothetical protein A3K18_19765 [Lentisphaerae bacterium RIFOXYA12_64_32]OGV85530.1 MAG: hypothetical protein A3K19_28515 [Lentisphaerae bacterium RIFOXYB12_FULL_65_16]
MRNVRHAACLALALGLLLVGTGCCGLRPCTGHGPGSSASGPAWVQDELYFGTSRIDGGSVTDQEWTEFLASVVTPRFPAGLTVLDANGQWRGAKGDVVKERSKLVIILHPPSAEANAAIREIVAQYKTQFKQESVLHARHRVVAEF